MTACGRRHDRRLGFEVVVVLGVVVLGVVLVGLVLVVVLIVGVVGVADDDLDVVIDVVVVVVGVEVFVLGLDKRRADGAGLQFGDVLGRPLLVDFAVCVFVVSALT